MVAKPWDHVINICDLPCPLPSRFSWSLWVGRRGKDMALPFLQNVEWKESITALENLLQKQKSLTSFK